MNRIDRSDGERQNNAGEMACAGHFDGEITDALADEWRAESLAPLDVPGSLLTVDTTDLSKVDYEMVLREIQRFV